MSGRHHNGVKPCKWEGCTNTVRHRRSRYCPACRPLARVAAERKQVERMAKRGAKLQACIARCDTVSGFIDAVRIQRKQAWLATRLGTHRNTVWNWCNGRAKPSPMAWRAISDLAESRQRTVKL